MEKREIFLSTNLKYLRKKFNVTQDQLGRLCDKSSSCIANYEAGTREPTAVDLGIIAFYFNITVDDLLLKDLRFENEDIEETLQNSILDNVKLCTKEEKEQILSIINVIKKGDK